ncbi:peptidoglycan-binding protein [Streptomyces sp. NRRL S-118]|uniref:peptidoglycan-binding protein n=1 Tax=Streptomyces sp. NRRL S-118 TaxID=1463881 RepID=UPI00099CB31A|nr:peptidoglycan-binding protein [Streptomyces sp. NRRL S-118]
MYWKIAEDMEVGDAVSILAISHVFYEDSMRTGGSISWTNKNPGNIVRSGEAESYGAYRGKYNYLFAIFPSEEAGFQGIRKFLRHPNRRTKTILGMMKIYAPAGHGSNTPEQYAQAIVDALGGGVSTSTRVDDLSDQQITKFAEKIKQVEGWATGEEFGPDNLPEHVREWLEQYPTRAERAAADQPFAKTGVPNSEGVKNIQRRLNDFGWTPPLVVDGIFGAKTEAAVKNFQQKNGLVADGIVGNKTWRKLVGL